MKIFFTDETNISRDRQLEFFVFGGVIVEISQIRPIVARLNEIKHGRGIDIYRPIQWSNKGREPLDPTVHTLIKADVLSLVSEMDFSIIMYLTLQDLYHRYTIEDDFDMRAVIDLNLRKRTQQYAMNVCTHKFNSVLENDKDLGMILTDSFDNSIEDHMANHCMRLFYEGGDFSQLTNIFYTAIQTDEECSPLHQINDVVLGAVQHSLKELHKNFLPNLKNKFLADSDGIIIGHGFSVYPLRPAVPEYKEAIQKVVEKFDRLINAVI